MLCCLVQAGIARITPETAPRSSGGAQNLPGTVRRSPEAANSAIASGSAAVPLHSSHLARDPTAVCYYSKMKYAAALSVHFRIRVGTRIRVDVAGQ